MYATATRYALMACLIPCCALAEEPIATDRPDFVESSDTVGPGRWQIETSVAWDSLDGVHTYSTPTLFRRGLGERWELRLETDGFLHVRGDGPDQSGMADLSIGAKYHFADASGAIPSTALLLHADLATGARAFRGHGVRPSLRLVAEWDLSETVSLGLMPGLIRDDDGSGRDFTAGIFGAVLGKAWTPRWRTFVELAMPQIASDRNGGTQSQVDVGSAWLLDDNTQLDAVYSRGLDADSPDDAFAVGFSIRF